jgi:hypothetical protein
MRCSATALAILVVLSVSLTLAEDFTTIKGKVYKDATISRVEADGIVVKTKTGISKIYFAELPKDVQERFRPAPAATVAAQSKREPFKLKNWKTAVENLRGFITFRVGAAIVIAGLIFLIVRSRLRQRAKSK